MKLCIPVTDCFRAKESDFLKIVEAVSYKAPQSKFLYSGKKNFLESSHWIAASDFRKKMKESGCLEALATGEYMSFACDIGLNCKRTKGFSENGFPRAFHQSKPISDSEYLSRAVDNVNWLRSTFSGIIKLENNNYFPTGAYERICEPDFICQLIELTGTELLLDIGHTLVSAYYLQYKDSMSYINALPLNRVSEIQLSQAGMLGGVYEDLHEVPGEREFLILDEILTDRCRIAYITVEYYKDSNKLYNAYQTLAEKFSIRKK